VDDIASSGYTSRQSRASPVTEAKFYGGRGQWLGHVRVVPYGGEVPSLSRPCDGDEGEAANHARAVVEAAAPLAPRRPSAAPPSQLRPRPVLDAAATAGAATAGAMAEQGPGDIELNLPLINVASGPAPEVSSITSISMIVDSPAAIPTTPGTAKWVNATKMRNLAGERHIKSMYTRKTGGILAFAFENLGIIMTLVVYMSLVYIALVYGLKLYKNIEKGSELEFMWSWLWGLVLKSCFLDWTPALQRVWWQQTMLTGTRYFNSFLSPFDWFEGREDAAQSRKLVERRADGPPEEGEESEEEEEIDIENLPIMGF